MSEQADNQIYDSFVSGAKFGMMIAVAVAVAITVLVLELFFK